MVSRKRDRAEMESSEPTTEPTTEPSILTRLRDMWEFSNLMQYIFIFGKAVKIDDEFTIEDLESECIKTGPSEKLAEIGLALLKNVSSHKGLTPDLFDEYTRRQYVTKAPERNPFGTEETPNKFASFEVFTKIRVLSQLSRWTLINADRLREKIPEAKDIDQTEWRVEEIGYDKQERLYYVLDDNRLYRRTDPPPPKPPAPKPKANSKKGRAAARASKRRKTVETGEGIDDPETEDLINGGATDPLLDNGFGGRKWECIAKTLHEYQQFLGTIQKSKDSDENALYERISIHALPVIEKAEEAHLKLLAKRERELMNLEKLATAKRSSRLASKMEREREEREALEAERAKKAELEEAKKDHERQKKMDEARESRMMTREQRLKEREYKRILHEEELANLSEENKRLDAGEARLSERQLNAEMEKKKKEIAALTVEDEWSFDCSVCGVHGENLDDGSHSIACEKCNVWQHSACHSISKAEAEKEHFHFVCDVCHRRAEDAKKPKIPTLKFHLNASSSPPSHKAKDVEPNGPRKRKPGDKVSNMPPLKKFKPPVIHHPQYSDPLGPVRPHIIQDGMHKAMMNGPTLAPYGQVSPLTYGNGHSAHLAQPPPGLRSPPGPPAYSNGYSDHSPHQNGHSKTYSSTSPEVLNIASPTNNKSPSPGWSARYSPHESAQTPQRPPNPKIQTPDLYHSSFESQRPNSSHSSHTLPNSMREQPPFSTNSASHPIFPPSPPANSTKTSPHPPPAYSPVKQQSSPPRPPLQLPSSSPTNHPQLQQNPPSSPGLSPTKQSPPRVNQQSPSLDIAETPLLPPAPIFEPNGVDHKVPSKVVAPESLSAMNVFAVEKSNSLESRPVASDEMEAEIKAHIPGVDPIISEYSAGYLTHASHSYTSESDQNAQSPLAEAAETITELLLSASGNLSDQNATTVRNLVDKFIAKLSAANGIDEEKRQMASTTRKLEHVIQVGSQRNMSSTLGLTTGTVDLESANTRKVESRVDRKKLEKAERKIQAKQDRKVMKNVEYEASRLLDQPDDTQTYEQFYMQVNPLQLGAEQSSKSKDIKVEGVDVSIGGKRILTDTTLTMAFGRRYGLVGQNGIGKSTLLRALSRRELAIPTHISILHVEQEITGDDTPALQAVLDADVWRKHLLSEQEKISKQLVELEAERSSMADTSTDAERLDKEREGLDTTLSDIHAKLSEMESDKAESRAASILAGLGFSEERQHFATKTFSGGWRMRLALARALFCEPDLLLLDEPSNMLDVPSITFLSNYLQSYPSTLLVVSHDRAFLNEVATDIIHQHSERLDYYKGADFDSFYATKEERRKTAQREYENQMIQRAHLQLFIDKFRYNAAKSSEAQSRIKKLEKMPILEPPESVYTVQFKFPEVEKLSPPIIQMSNVSFGYSPGKPLLRNIDLDVQLDSRIGIVGPNGAGKTTVLKLLIGQLEPTSGLISQNPRLRVGFFAQHHVDALDMNASAVGFMAKNYPGKADEEYRRHLGAFGITGTTGLQKMALLSGGQKSRVAFACLSLTNPHILVLDEPSNHLDIEAMDALSLALRQFQGGVLMVSHDVTMLQTVCSSLWVCEQGTVEKFSGDVKAYKKRITAQAGASGVVEVQK